LLTIISLTKLFRLIYDRIGCDLKKKIKVDITWITQIGVYLTCYISVLISSYDNVNSMFELTLENGL
jgi:hypothetical protein